MSHDQGMIALDGIIDSLIDALHQAAAEITEKRVAYLQQISDLADTIDEAELAAALGKVFEEIATNMAGTLERVVSSELVKIQGMH